MTRRLLILAFVLFIGALPLVGCAAGRPDRVWLQAPSWSRGVALGPTASSQPPAMALLADDQLALVRQPTGGPADFSLLIVNLTDGTWTDQPLELPLTDRSSQLALVADGDRLWLVWRQAGQLTSAEIGLDGRLKSGPSILGDGRPVASFAALAGTGQEPVVVLSYADESPGIALAYLGRDEATLELAPAGSSPAAAYDGSGRLHLAWLMLPAASGLAQLDYARVDRLGDGPVIETRVVEFSLGSSDVLEGPLIAVASERVYLAYTVSIRTGLRAGDVDSMLVSFPLDDPGQVGPTVRLSVPTSGEPVYDLPAAGMASGPRAHLEGGTFQVTQLNLAPQEAAELLAVARARVDFLMNQTQTQIIALYG